jgi:hypothetical protein
MSFRVGQKVVCVKNGAAKWRGQTQARVGEIYTIRDVYVDPISGDVGIHLAEIINPLHPCGIEYGFYAKRFRPVVSRKTDISIFHAILNGAPVKEVVL